MTYSVDPNAKNVWIRDNADTMDLSVQTDAHAVYLENGRTLEQEVGKGTMVSNVVTVDSSMEKVVEGTYDGAYESCKMYGKSLVNAMTKAIDTTWNLNLTNWSFLITAPSDFILKPSTTYSVIVYVTEKTCPDRDDLFWIGDVDGRQDKVTNDIVRKNVSLGANVFVINTISDFTNLSSTKGGIGFQGSRFVEGTLRWKAIVLEGDWTNKELPPYFEGLCDVKMPILKSVGKNLFDGELELGTISSSNGVITPSTTRVRSLEYLMVNSNTTYTLSNDLNYANDTIYEYDENLDYIGRKSSATFTTSTNCKHIKFSTKEGECDLSVKYQLEEGSAATEHKPYKTSILTTPEEVILRKVGDVCDSYDALTGEYVQRIAEQTINGSENWGKMDEDTAIQNDTCLFTCYGALSNVPRDTKYLSDKYNIITGYQELLNTDKEMVHLYLDRALYFRISKSKLATVNIEGFKQWLAQNPFTIQYQLETPTTTIIEPSTIPFVYENGHIILESGYEGQSLLPTLEYSTVINRTGQIQSIANTVQKQEKQITTLEQMLIQNIVDLDYNNTLLTLGLEINEVI